MGFFTKDATPSAQPNGALLPLAKDRIKHALEQAGWSYNVDSDGDIGGGWEYGSFYFFVNGNQDELLCVRGHWRGQLSDREYAQIVDTCNTWNREKLWPKTYAARDDEGVVRVFTEHNVDYEHGVSDEQLNQHIVCAVNTSMAFFEQVNETFPEAWAKFKPEE